MFFIDPLTISDGTSNGLRTSTDCTDESKTAWAVGTTFVNIGDQCSYLHGIYQSRIANNLGNKPTYRTTDTNWLYVGDLNSWAMFDDTVETKTTNADKITVRITPGVIANGLFLGDCDAISVTVTMTDPIEGIVYSKTVNMRDNNAVVDALTWLAMPILARRDVVFLDLPFYLNAVIDVTIDNTGGTAGCGLFKLGLLWTIGNTQWGAGVSIIDYSKVTTDDFGHRVLVKRGYAKKGSFPLELDQNLVDAAARFFADKRQVPGVFIGSEVFEATMMYGTYSQFQIIITMWGISSCSVEVLGAV